jgi:hypothetical protein
VVKGRTWFTLFMVSFGTLAATVSCGSDEATGGSSGGGNIISGGGIAGSLGHAGSVGRAGSGGGGGSSTSSTSLGIECTSDAQCGDGMVCAKANGTLFGSGGPSLGMCTMACDTADATNAECDALKPGAACFNFGTKAAPAGYCLDSCEQGTPLDVTSKCAGRPDFVCADLGDATAPAPFCVPHCRSDAECGTGLFCDKSNLLGLCSKTKPTGTDPVGTPCTPGDMPSTCQGACLRTSADGVMPVTGVCSELCSAGAECLYGSGSKPKPGGFCGGQLTDVEIGAIDLAFCLPNCSCTGDCTQEGDLCRKWPDADADLATLLGAPGVCYPVVAQSVELTCGEGGAGGDGAGGAAGAGGDGSMAPGAAGASGSSN